MGPFSEPSFKIGGFKVQNTELQYTLRQYNTYKKDGNEFRGWGRTLKSRKEGDEMFLFIPIYLSPHLYKTLPPLKTSLYRLIYKAMWYILINGTKYLSCKQNLDPINTIQQLYLKNKQNRGEVGEDSFTACHSRRITIKSFLLCKMRTINCKRLETMEVFIYK